MRRNTRRNSNNLPVLSNPSLFRRIAMQTLARILIVGTALLTTPVYADESADSRSEILNGQVNLNTVWSTTNLKVNHVDTDVGATANGIGNTAQIYTMNDTVARNDQLNLGDIGAEVNAKVGVAHGNVILGATTLCNGAVVSTDPMLTAVKSKQICGGTDPVATVNARLGNVDGGVGVNVMSVANQLEVDSNASRFPVSNFQENRSATFANANVKVDTAKIVSIGSTAVGNTAQIIHY
jgi:hypothetical protein